MNHPDWQLLAEKAALYLYPRRCPFCGAVLGRDAVQGTVCPACFEAADKRLVHLPPRLPETEHAFYALNSAVAAYYYSGEVRHAILACKRGGELWRARELADRMAVLIWGAMPSHTPGRRPAALAPVGMPRYHYIVPVPPREPLPGTAGMPLLLARRLGILMQTPVLAPLYSTKPLQPQKELTRAERLANKKDAYACRPGTDLSGKRVLLVDLVVVLISAFVYRNYESPLYAIINIFVSSKLIDAVLYGADTGTGKMMFIISPKNKEIAQRIMTDISRGVTELRSRGAYRGEEGEVLLCAVRRSEVYKTQDIIRSVDPGAFVIVGDAGQISGEGFKQNHKSESK